MTDLRRRFRWHPYALALPIFASAAATAIPAFGADEGSSSEARHQRGATHRADDSKSADSASSEPNELKTAGAASAEPKAAEPKSSEGTPGELKSEEQPAGGSAGPVAAEPPHRLRGIVLHRETGGWGASFYGFAELDAIYDTTRSFNDGELNITLQRPNTYPGDNPRTQFTVRNSRIGFDVRAPDVGSLRTSGNVEMDFFGSQASPNEGDLYTNAALRVRHFYLKFQTPLIDILAGQYHDLYGWGGAGFYPNTDAFLPLLGEIYHRNPQLRLSKVFGGEGASFEIAVAAVRPGQRDAVMPDGQAGILLRINSFKGAAAPGASRPAAAPFGVGISAVGRRLSVTDFSQVPGNERTKFAGGIAGNLFLPIVPAHGPDGEDLSNTVSLTLEGSMHTGMADLYPALTGGVQFPSLPNPLMLLPVPVYTPNVDPGIATYDAGDKLQTISWSSGIANLSYHLPIEGGKRVWISLTGGLIRSSNSVDLTPFQGRAFAWNKGRYGDLNLWLSPTKPLVLALSLQAEAQTFGDGVTSVSYRGEGSCFLFF